MSHTNQPPTRPVRFTTVRTDDLVGDGPPVSWRARPGSQPIAAILILLLGLTVAGLVLYFASPSAPIVSAATAHKYLWPNELRPEPGEQFIYIGLLLAMPSLLGLSVAAARRWCPSDTAGRADRRSQPDARNESMTRFASLLCLIACAVSALVPLGSLPFGPAAIDDGAGAGFASHWDAVFYSVVQISRGETCLAAVKPQYGCYGEFLRPIFSIVGLSVARASVLFAALQAAASVCVIWFCFRNLRTGFALAAGLWFVVISNATTNLGGQYFQYMPVRFLFPAASLFLLPVWQRRGNAWEWLPCMPSRSPCSPARLATAQPTPGSNAPLTLH